MKLLRFRILVFPISIMWSVWVESIPEAGEGKIVSWGFMNFGLAGASERLWTFMSMI